ncbi:MAG: hypothetical protein K0M45_00885 [Candidatus Paracaedibacteraceae bacterium]|nr:hypothetical protein [Candidatus Paracaedibacteraceae bacterium]
MLKPIGIIGLLMVLNIECDAVECLYGDLKGRVETYTGKITESIPSTKDKIEKDLTFLAASTTEDNIIERYKSQDFAFLYKKSVELAQDDKIFKDFINICKAIYDEGNDLTKQAIYILLYDVKEELQDYYSSIRRRKASISKVPSSKKVENLIANHEPFKSKKPIRPPLS